MPATPSEDLLALGQTIREFREDAGLTMDAAAERWGFSVSHLSRIERGRVNTTFSFLLKIADGLGVPVHELVRAAERLTEERRRR